MGKIFKHNILYGLLLFLIIFNSIEFIFIFPDAFFNGISNSDILKFGVNSNVLATGQYYRLFVAIFLHVNWLHMVSNIFWLFLIILMYDSRFRFSSKFLLFFILGVSFVSEVVFMFLYPTLSTVGISSGLFAVTTLYLVYVVKNDEYKVSQVKYITMFVIFFFLVFGDSTGDTTSHVIGLIAGFVAGIYYRFFVNN